MSASTYDCPCGATLRYRQDMDRRLEGHRTTWVCSDCGTPVTAVVAEKLRHQHPS
jgi:predicted RNA-binding Zn-ribbon protein involved in translation (DUF1610 family)